MTTIAFRVISHEPFIVEYMSGNKRKEIKYDVPLTNKEIMAEAHYVVFDN